MTIHSNMFDNPTPKMRGSIQTLSASDIIKPANLKLINSIGKIWDENVGTDYLDRDTVILESVGGWLYQGAWVDVTGYHIMIRMHPLYSHQARVQGRARAVINAFVGLFPDCKIEFTENVHVLDVGDVDWRRKEKMGLNETITIVVQTACYSIGD